MKITRQFKSLFKRDESKDRDFNEILNEILDDTFKKKSNLHVDYYFIVQRILSSKRPVKTKTTIVKYLLARLTRESERIFLKASLLASRMCPCCSKTLKSDLKTVFSEHSTRLH